MAKKTTRNRRQRRQRKIARTRKMIGGAYSPTELQDLQSAQFSENQIQTLQQMNIPFNDVMVRINQLRNQVPDDELGERVMVEIINEQIFQNPNAENIDAIPHAQDDFHDMNLSFNSNDGSLHLSDLNDDESLHMSDLDVSQDSMRANTTVGDESFGNSSMSDGSLSSISTGNESLASEYGGKRRRRKTRKNRRRNQKGGVLSQDDQAQLIQAGFTNDDVNYLNDRENINALSFVYLTSQSAPISIRRTPQQIMTQIRQIDRETLRDSTNKNFSSLNNLSNNKEGAGKRKRRSRKQRGGMCYGNGVGANSYDPNYSIYNTNMLKLFPYRTQ